MFKFSKKWVFEKNWQEMLLYGVLYIDMAHIGYMH
uniref:Uncharacterized protein n=1 Tax=Ciona intestinalis TaxID=7719 RepID=H2XP48_CIOIN